MQIIFQTIENVLIVKILGELDHHGAEQIREKIDSKIKAANLKNLILDLSELKFMDSSGIGIIIGRYKLVKSIGGHLMLVTGSKSIDKIIKMCGVEKIIAVKDNVNDALKCI